MKIIDYKSYIKPSDFITFPVGKTYIQIVSKGAIGKIHTGVAQGRFMTLGICNESPSCSFCVSGSEPKNVWRWIVVEKKSKEVRVLNAGSTLGNSICDIAKNEDPEIIEIEVIKEGEGKKSRYSAKKSSEGFLTPEERKALETKRVYLVKKYLML